MKKEDKIAVIKKMTDISIMIEDVKGEVFNLWKEYPELNKDKNFLVEFSSINNEGLEPAKEWVWALIKKLES